MFEGDQVGNNLYIPRRSELRTEFLHGNPQSLVLIIDLLCTVLGIFLPAYSMCIEVTTP
jgi:hypothetical protein